MIIARNRLSDININLQNVPKVSELKLLGVFLTHDLKWDTHIKYIVKNCNRKLYALRILRPMLSDILLFSIFKSLILPIIDYAGPLFVSLPACLNHELDPIIKNVII